MHAVIAAAVVVAVTHSSSSYSPLKEVSIRRKGIVLDFAAAAAALVFAPVPAVPRD